MAQNRSASRLGRALVIARRKARLTQGALAVLVKCNERSVRQAESGMGRTDLFLEMAAALGQTVAGRSLPPGKLLGERLLALRRRTGQSRGLAGVSGVGAATIRAIEHGGLGHLAALERVADALRAGLVLAPTGSTPFFTGPAASSAWDAWATPQAVLDRLYEVLDDGFDLDPCSPGRGISRVRARVHFDEADDGLALPWHGSVFMNPPYGRGISKWVAKAANEVGEGRAEQVLGLVPARTDTAWWHSSVASRADVWLLKRRLAFGDGTTCAPFPSAMVLWGGDENVRVGICRAFPDAWNVPAGHVRGR